MARSGQMTPALWRINVQTSTINGSIINTGEINSTSFGFFLVSAVFKDLINYGSISVFNGGSDYAALIVSSSLNAFYNYGSLSSDYYSIYNPDSTLKDIYMRGVSSTSGDIVARSATLHVDQNAYYSSSSSIDAYSLSIEDGSTMKVVSTKSNNFNNDTITLANGLTNNGTLEVPAGSIASITGDYIQTNTGKLQVNVDDNATYGKLNVSGTATFPSNAQIVVNVSNPKFSFTTNQLSGIISAGTLVSDGTFKVTDNSLLFDFSAVKNDNQVDLLLSASSAAPTDNATGGETIYKSVMDNNQKFAAGAAVILDSFVSTYAANSTTGNSDMDAIVTNFGRLATEAQVSAAATQTLPLLNGQVPTVVQNQLQNNRNAIAGRLDSERGMSAVNNMQIGQNAWIKAYNSRSIQHDQDMVPGYLAQTSGGVLGIDTNLKGNDLTLGVAFGFDNTHIAQNNGRHNASISNYQGIIYGSKKPVGNYADFVDFQADIGYQDVSGDRKIQFSEINRVARSSYQGYSYHLGSTVGKNFLISDRIKVQPVLGIDYTFVKSNGYTESGADSLDLIVASQRSKQLMYSAGLQLDVKMNDRSTLYGKAGVGYDQFAHTSSIVAAFAGANSSSFATSGINSGHWVRTLSMGLKEEFIKGLTANLIFDVMDRDHGATYSWAAKLNKNF